MNDLTIPALDAPTPTITSARTRRSRQRIFFAALALFALGIGLRLIANAKSSAELEASTSAALERTVMITRAKPGALTRNISLPATLRGNNETAIYARSNGYVVSINKDIGDSVKQGELLATIAAPEQDQELAQAQATQTQTQARAQLAQLTAERYESLRLKDGISQTDLEEKRSELQQERANLAAADANVKRLQQLRALRSIVAPFSGVVTRRNINVGDLIATGNRELFALSQIDPLKLTVWVPQAYASQVKIGQQVHIELNEFQHESIVATVKRFAGGIDTQTRSRQVDLVLPNPSGKFLPGAYAEAHIDLTSNVASLIAPSSILMTTADGFQAAVVDHDNHIVFRDIKIGRDLGREIEVLDGIASDDTLVVSPSDLLVEGELVKTLVWEPKKNEKTKTAESENHKKPNDSPTNSADNKDSTAAPTKS